MREKVQPSSATRLNSSVRITNKNFREITNPYGDFSFELLTVLLTLVCMVRSCNGKKNFRGKHVVDLFEARREDMT